jgi:ATP-binding cassette subfamily C (CFTR/MRP) protein 1
VTNSLFVLPNVDLIVVLKDGKVSDIGTYDNLMAQKGEFADLISQYSSNKNDEPKEN